MKEVALVLKRELFSSLLSSCRKELEKLCKGADKFASCEDSILIHWTRIDWVDWNDNYVSLMVIISKLDLESDPDFHFLEWNDDFIHKDEMGSYYLNPWKTDLETGVGTATNEKIIDLKAFF